MRFDGKTIIVTGAGGGIGQACAQRLHDEGANLVLIDRDAGALAAAQATLASPDRLLVRAQDVSVETEAAAAFEAAIHRFGRVDGVVSVAGAMIYKGLDALTGQDWERIMAVNFYAAAHFTRQAFNHMEGGGSLVYVSSIHARQTSALVGPYAAAKAALTSLARTAAIEGRACGIRANCVLPGAVDTPMLRDSPNIKSGLEVLDPQDVGQPEDIAALVAFALSDEARFVTGAELVADGGRLAKL
ncbi:SDR family NAD(P)-dependent oxidoreductase [Caulobacter endophyticus]|uniref:SDR family NAD(P)-dependent oxidoreductase n=1 Tax=Caulobacter endophyticus TaxID=2172652 RepID=UPI00240F916C|nr:SDR family oxidoreductase [Caulobacter endophyticus]MDG2527240.1 SDR family NAD(P)-dependent oxidoreductase [Caulobacter endophyticus]